MTKKITEVTCFHGEDGKGPAFPDIWAEPRVSRLGQREEDVLRHVWLRIEQPNLALVTLQPDQARELASQAGRRSRQGGIR